jgi:transposase InsO family protein
MNPQALWRRFVLNQSTHEAVVFFNSYAVEKGPSWKTTGTVEESYDNAFIENLWSLIERETYTKNITIEEARLEIFSWINWYNNQRIHGSLNYLTPQEFKELKLDKVM